MFLKLTMLDKLENVNKGESKVKEITQEQAIVIRKTILGKFHEICQCNGIKYSLGYGTLLGAVRHGGMIPWDDDVDVVVLREDFEKLQQIYSSNNCKDQFQFVCHKNHPEIKTKIGYFIDYSTITETAFKTNDYHGIHIDVYPIDVVPNNWLQKKILFMRRAFLQVLIRAKDVHPEVVNTGYQKLIRQAVLLLCSPFSYDKALDQLHNIAKKYRNLPENEKKTGCVIVDSERPAFFPYSLTKEYKLYKYDDNEYWGYKDYDTFLKTWYNDYMTPPPVEKQVKPKHEFVRFFYKDAK